MSAARLTSLPRWVDLGLLPFLNLSAALIVSGLVIALIGENPFEALVILVNGAVGYQEAIGYTLHYATNFMFTGLAVAVAFHAGLFNIGGEGQAYVAGLGVALVCLALPGWPWWSVLPIAMIAAIFCGAAWAIIPGYLQAARGSHVVVTTIMFNFLATAFMTWMLVDVIRAEGQQAPQSAAFPPSTHLPTIQDMGAFVGLDLPRMPLNLGFFLAILTAILVYLYIWHSRWGYELRTVGTNETAAVYAGMPVPRLIIVAMVISGALAGLAAINEVMGVQHRLVMNWTGGVGYVGIAVALMGRNHPVGIALSALLFGALYQGGSDLAFEIPAITREMIVVIQGLVILFCGALENLFRAPLEAYFKPKSA
jgi:simple sugar transport system permease protein